MTTSGQPLARLARPRGSRTRLAVVADPHLTDRASGTWKVYHRTVARFRSLISDLDRAGIDGVLVAGDLTKDGHTEEFQLARELLALLDVPYVAVPGNHDVPGDDSDTPPVEAFERRFGPGPYPATKRIGSVDVVAIDTASHPGGSDAGGPEGMVTPAEQSALASELATARNPLLLGHHNLFPPGSRRGTVDVDHLHEPVDGRTAVLDLLEQHEVSLAVTGHNHWPGITRRRGLTELASPATCSVPQSYFVLTVEPTGTTVELVPLADTVALEEAYQYARSGSPRARAIASAIHSGYFGEFPLLDDRPNAETEFWQQGVLKRLLQ